MFYKYQYRIKLRVIKKIIIFFALRLHLCLILTQNVKVIISIIYVLIYNENSKTNVRKRNPKKTKKAIKIKYSKDFLKRVDGVDLNLK